MELVQHEVVHSRQASVLTFKCSLSKRWSVNAIPLWLWSANVFATKSVPFEFHIEVNRWTWGSWGSPEMVLDFYSGVYVTYLFRDLQHHPTSMGLGSRSLRWDLPCSWSLHRIGCPDIRTQICCGRATALFLLGWWRRWSREPMTAIYLLPLLPRIRSILLALWLSLNHPPPSLPFHTISRCILKLYPIFA